MNRFIQTFAKGPAFVGYLTAGQGGMAAFESAALALIAGGVDILEIGVPFSDPIADGPTIQQAMIEPVLAGVDMTAVLTSISNIRSQTDVPIVLFTYANPLHAYLTIQTMADIKSAGVDGMLVVDLPLEESDIYYTGCEHADLQPVILLSPSTPVSRLQQLPLSQASFLYYVCRNGTTGVKAALPMGVAEKIAAFNRVTNVPVVCGFGIGDKQSAKQAIQAANGFVVGSAFVAHINAGGTPETLTQLAQAIDPR